MGEQARLQGQGSLCQQSSFERCLLESHCTLLLRSEAYCPSVAAGRQQHAQHVQGA